MPGTGALAALCAIHDQLWDGAAKLVRLRLSELPEWAAAGLDVGPVHVEFSDRNDGTPLIRSSPVGVEAEVTWSKAEVRAELAITDGAAIRG